MSRTAAAAVMSSPPNAPVFDRVGAETQPNAATKRYDARDLANALARMTEVDGDDATLVPAGPAGLRRAGPLASDDVATLEAQAPVIPPGVPSPLGDDDATIHERAFQSSGAIESFTLEDLGFDGDELLAAVAPSTSATSQG